MGNTQCVPEIAGATSTDDHGDDGDLYAILGDEDPSAVFNAQWCLTSDPVKVQEKCLLAHRQDRPQRCILDQKEVKKAIYEQAEELMRRERPLPPPVDVASENTEVDDNEQDNLSEDVDTILSGIVSSDGVSETDVTTTTAGTRPTRNFDRYRFPTKPKKSRDYKHAEINEQQRRQGNATEILNKDGETSQTATSQSDAECEDSSAQGESTATVDALAGEDKSDAQTAELPNSCPEPLSCLESSDSQSNNTALNARMLRFLEVLHLKMTPHCYRYHKNYLARVLPESSTARAMSDIPMDTLGSSCKPEATQDEELKFGEGPSSAPVRILATNKVFMDLAVAGGLGLVPRRAYASKRFKSLEHYLVLLNRRSGVPLAVCAVKAASAGLPIVRMYSTKRRVYAQLPAATTKRLGINWCSDSYPLYAWAEIVTHGKSHEDRVRYSIFMASGSNGLFEDRPSYLAAHDSSSSSNGSWQIRMVGRTEWEEFYTGCAVLSFCRVQINEEEEVTRKDKDDVDGIFFKLSISRGIDPALLICFAAFVDEVMEKTMRQQCASHARSEKK